MNNREFKALVTKHKGWIEHGKEEKIARFPSVFNKEQFEKECTLIEESALAATIEKAFKNE